MDVQRTESWLHRFMNHWLCGKSLELGKLIMLVVIGIVLLTYLATIRASVIRLERRVKSHSPFEVSSGDGIQVYVTGGKIDAEVTSRRGW